VANVLEPPGSSKVRGLAPGPHLAPVGGREGRGPLPSVAQACLELQVDPKNPREWAASRASVLRLVERMFEQKLRLDRESLDQLGSMAAFLAEEGPTTNDRKAGATIVDRLKRTRANSPLPVEVEYHSACEARPNAMTKAELIDAFSRCVRCLETMSLGLWRQAVRQLLVASGHSADQAADALIEAKAQLLASRAMTPNNCVSAAVEDVLESLLQKPEKEVPRWDSWPQANQPTEGGLLSGQRAILTHLTTHARVRQRLCQPELAAFLDPKAIAMVERLFHRAPIHLRFRCEGSADRHENDPIRRAFLESGRTNGNPEVIARQAIESRLFGFQDSTPVEIRPNYGYLNLSNAPEGQAHSFGDCVWVLKHELKARATLNYGDSGRTFAGALGTFEPGALGEVLLDTCRMGPLANLLSVARGEVKSAPWCPDRRGMPWLEVQIHGRLNLQTDVAALVIGPEAAGTPAAEKLIRLARRWGIEVYVAPPTGLANIGFLD
jgi:hypothetical protein